jgi:phenylpropionate dioxygenase-like ring-hydroxylating dioxygenase large terminal subunit
MSTPASATAPTAPTAQPSETESQVQQATARLLSTGVRNLWYPVAASWQLGAAPLGITRLGENLVLWRNALGQVQALEDRCPHRGARLSLGWNLGERVACWYHGVQVSGQGVVELVPAVNNCPLEGQACVRSYPAKEVAGAIFVWFGLEAHTPPAPVQWPEQLVAPQWSQFLCLATWQCNYRYAIDNVMDPMHGAYLHAASHSMAEGDKQAQMRVRKTATGLIFEKVGQQGVNFDWVELGDTGALWLRLAIPYKKRFGPGGPFTIIGFATPIDSQRCQVYFWRCREVQGWQRSTWQFLYRNRLEGLHWTVLEQDRVLLENMAPNATDHEFLYEHDVGLSRVRRMLQKRAEAQARELVQNATKTQPSSGATPAFPAAPS